MSSSTPSKLPASARTVLELGARRSLEVSRTVPVSTAASLLRTVNAMPAAEARLAIGTTPPSNGLDAHLMAIGTPPPGAQLVAPHVGFSSPQPKTVFLDGPAFVPPARGVKLAPKPMPPRPRAQILLALIYGLLALVIAPLAPLAWMHAAEQLDLIARGACRESGKSILHAVQGIGIAMTMVAVAATAFGLTVVVARLMH